MHWLGHVQLYEIYVNMLHGKVYHKIWFSFGSDFYIPWICSVWDNGLPVIRFLLGNGLLADVYVWWPVHQMWCDPHLLALAGRGPACFIHSKQFKKTHGTSRFSSIMYMYKKIRFNIDTLGAPRNENGHGKQTHYGASEIWPAPYDICSKLT